MNPQLHSEGSGPVFISYIIGRLGDLVCMLPKLRFLARRHGAPVHLLIRNHGQKRLFANIRYVRKTYSLEQWRIPLFFSPAQRHVAAELAGLGLRRAYIFHDRGNRRAIKTLALLRQAGIPDQAIQYGLPEWDFPGQAPDWLSPSLEDAAPPAIHVPEEDRERMRERLRRECGWEGEPIVLFHPGTNSEDRWIRRNRENGSRWWQPEKWIAVVKGTAATLPSALRIVTGSRKEGDLIDRVADGAGGKKARVHAWPGKTSLEELLALQSLAHSGVMGDTGPAHTATATGCRLVMLFGAKEPRGPLACPPLGWGPLATVRGCNPLSKNNAIAPWEAIRHIRPETVLRAWRALPPRPPSPPARCFISHYLEGRDEPEVLPAGYGRPYRTD